MNINYRDGEIASKSNENRKQLTGKAVALTAIVALVAIIVVAGLLKFLPILTANVLDTATLIVLAFVMGWAASRLYYQRLMFYIFSKNLQRARRDLGLSEGRK